MRRAATVLMLFALCLSAGSRAAAQSSAPPTDAQREQARQHFQRATELVGEQRWRDAIVELEATRAIIVTPAVLYNLGLARRAVGQTREAIAAFDELERLAGSGMDPAMRTEVDDYLRELRAALAHLQVTGAPPNATITLDGEPLAALDADVNAGRHVLVASAAGFRSLTRTVDVQSGERVEVPLALEAVRVVTRMQIDADVGSAALSIDGRFVGTGSAVLEVTPGRHVVDARASGRVAYHDEVNVAAGSVTRVRARLVAPRSVWTSPWLWGAAGVVVAGAAATIIAVAATSGASTADGVRPPWGVVATGLTLAH